MRKPRAPEWLLAALMAAMVAAASGASAQPRTQPQAPPQAQPSGPPNALQGFSQNRDQPVKIEAATLEVRDRNKVATFSGNVHLVQGDTVLRCKILVVFYDQDDAGAPAVKSATPGPTGSSQIRRMEAKGAVVVTQKDQTATGESAIYDLKTNTVTLVAAAGGNVAVTQGPNVMTGERLVVDLGTSVSHLSGGSRGVSGLIHPGTTQGAKTDNKTAPDPKGQDPKGPDPKGQDPKAAPKDAPKARATNPSGLY
jgi:lipopolysaccharide export system protein LptA